MADIVVVFGCNNCAKFEFRLSNTGRLWTILRGPWCTLFISSCCRRIPTASGFYLCIVALQKQPERLADDERCTGSSSLLFVGTNCPKRCFTRDSGRCSSVLGRTNFIAKCQRFISTWPKSGRWFDPVEYIRAVQWSRIPEIGWRSHRSHCNASKLSTGKSSRPLQQQQQQLSNQCAKQV